MISGRVRSTSSERSARNRARARPWCCPGAAPLRHAGHEPALGRGRTSRGARSPGGPADGPGRMAPRQGSRRARQSHAGVVASSSARIEPGREHLAISARELVVEPRVCLLPGHRRSLLRRLEPPHRPALDHHVHRPPELGQCMMISAGWYQIIPWNFPILMAVWKLAPALAAGNCVVLKPAEQTPASIILVMELIGDLLPPGVVNVVNGFGLEAGKPLASSPR